MKRRNNSLVILLIGIIIVILAVLCLLFVTGKIKFVDKKGDVNDVTNSNDNLINNNDSTSDVQENDVVSKLVNDLNSGNSETTFNGISVLINQKLNDSVCTTDNIFVNDNDIKSILEGSCVESYEFYNDNVILFLSGTGNRSLFIYNTTLKSVVFSSFSDEFKDYKIDSYSSYGNRIIINATGCGAQCGVSNDGEKAKFEITYSDGNFSKPVYIIE